MTKEEMQLIEANEIPKLVRGKRGKDWSKILNDIPVGQAWVLPKDFVAGATIRKAVATINEEADDELFKVTQRRNEDTDETTLYVIRLK